MFQVCYNQRCQDVKSVKAYGTSDCSSKCSNRGVGTVSYSISCNCNSLAWLSVISGRCVTMRTSATVTPAGLHRTVMCCCRSCLMVSYFFMKRSYLIFLSVDDLPHLYSTQGCFGSSSSSFFFYINCFLLKPLTNCTVCWTQPDSSFLSREKWPILKMLITFCFLSC